MFLPDVLSLILEFVRRKYSAFANMRQLEGLGHAFFVDVSKSTLFN